MGARSHKAQISRHRKQSRFVATAGENSSSLWRKEAGSRKQEAGSSSMATHDGCEEAEVVIVGAGIAGLATALALKRIGAKGVVVLERAPGLRATGAAISLSANAWRALAALGVAHKLTPLYRALDKGQVTNITTGTTQEMSFGEAPGSEELRLRTVHRRVLSESLAEELRPGTVRFSTNITSISMQSPKDASSGVVLQMEDGTAIRTKVLIGCDGVHSVVSQWLGLSAPVDSGRSAIRGLGVYPEGHGFNCGPQQFLLKNERGGFVPMNDKEIYWFLVNWSNPEDMETAKDPELILKHVTGMAETFPPSFLEIVHHSDPATVSLAPLVFRLPWHVVFGPTHKGNVVVIGDAMHPMTPDLGQGGCAALEDAIVLGQNLAPCLLLDGSMDKERVAGCLAKFVMERRWRVARLIAGAYMSGWTQQGGTGWWAPIVKIIRDSAFYRFLFPKLLPVIADYDCGRLPAPARV